MILEYREIRRLTEVVPCVVFVVTLNPLCMTFSAADGDDEGRDYRDVYEYADDGHEEKKCPEINLPSRLVAPCEISDFCSNITCQLEVAEKRFTVNFKINRCDDPITATVTIKSSGYSVNWTHTFKDGDIIEILPAADRGEMNSIAKVFFFFLFDLKKEGKKLHFKVRNINTESVFCLSSIALRKTLDVLHGQCVYLGANRFPAK